MIRKPRGTMDILPAEAAKWRFVEQQARDTAALFGFGEIRLPTFEATELFQRGVGDATDVVQKEMYTFSDRGGDSFTLRPEGTAGTVRAVIENGMYGQALPLKLFYVLNCFRYERPQAGRSREFFQFGAEIFGAPHASADAELIALAAEMLRRCGADESVWQLHINSIGCPVCRKDYHAALYEYFASRADRLCDTCKTRLQVNPMRILDCKCPQCQELTADAPRTVDYLCDDCKDHFHTLQELLTGMGLPFTVNPRIVRGLDYYTKTVFEFITDRIGAQSTVCGGGRYDGLVHELGGPAMCGLGFGMGLSRLLLLMEALGTATPADPPCDVFFVSVGEKAAVQAQLLAHRLRSAGVSALADTVGRSLKAQMKYADKLGARYTAVLGDDELAKGEVTLRSMADGNTRVCALSTLSPADLA